MAKQIQTNEHQFVKIIDSVSEGINDAEPVFSVTADPVVQESNGKQAVRYLLWLGF
ncbi:hypothetical protein [Lapidilactobacillus gannanensis]|uniref:Uncharacterized protein n=1 Tax=Lapidilactobacillus gannanensis TaxID=2486002 RepID=A0ABW4BIP8_9LACO|nr:hypothetical protein [Lapidilactobacillus gannanensis]